MKKKLHILIIINNTETLKKYQKTIKIIMETESEHATGILISFVKEMFYDEEYSIVFTYNEKK